MVVHQNTLKRDWEAIPADYKGETNKAEQTTDLYDL